MCWPYTIIYCCWDCMEAKRPEHDVCVVVKPNAEDPVAGGYNHEGWLCPQRYVGRPKPGQQKVAPAGCPSLCGTAAPPFAAVVGPYMEAFGGGWCNAHSNSGYSSPQYRFWVCPDHRPECLALGPVFGGYELALQTQRVEDERRADARRQVHDKAAAREEARGRQKEGRWGEVFDAVVSGSPQEKKLKTGDEAEAAATMTASVGETSSAAGEIGRTIPLPPRNKYQRYHDELDMP